MSIINLVSDSLVGVCTSRAFYILDYNGVIKNTLRYPAIFTRDCRMMESTTSGTHFLTAVSEQTYYRSNGVTYYPLWNIWRIETSPFNATLVQ